MTVYYDPDRVESGAFPALLAIGDSWFWYPFVSNLLAELSAVVKPDYSNILTLGRVGAKLEQFAAGPYAKQLARQLRPQNIVFYSALLISGGGNDAVDWRLCLRDDCTGLTTAASCIDPDRLANSMNDLSGWLLAFTLSLDDLVVASFVTGPSATTLPMAVFSSVRLGVSPEVNALATLFLVAVVILVALASLLMSRAERRRPAS